MKTLKLLVVLFVCSAMVLVSGCVGEQQYKDLRIKNDTQSQRISELDSQLQATKLNLEQAKRELETIGSRNSIEADTLTQKIAALEEDLAKKKGLIASMQQQLINGGAQLPVELSTMLEDFAKNEEMVTYDSARSMIKFKSDLLFNKGSDSVAADAKKAVKSLCKILNSQQAKNFDVIIAGHTDDVPIRKAQTRAAHPTNWHLSAHRAISVLNVMTKDGISSERTSIRGFGEFRPASPNKANKKGNPLNRRVEIYIVAKGI
ncbi:MAG: OmpA family protein [Planctomycetes bacterium]|nr:OmpA family protein [Planctomycetota bacterium]MCK5473235.1 OmpA family protein [Planctomycetota bacterium]